MNEELQKKGEELCGGHFGNFISDCKSLVAFMIQICSPFIFELFSVVKYSTLASREEEIIQIYSFGIHYRC